MRASSDKAWREAADGAIREAMVNLESVPAPAGEMDVVLGPAAGVMLHERSVTPRGDFNRKQTSAFAGLMGQRVAAKGVTVVDDGTMARGAARCRSTTRHADQPHVLMRTASGRYMQTARMPG